LVNGLREIPGDDVLRLESLSFSELLRNAVDEWHERESRLELTGQIPPEPMFTIGDRAKLALAVHKLLGSAVEFTQCCGKIHLRAHEEDNEITFRISAVTDGVPRAADGSCLSDVSISCAILRLHGGISSIDNATGESYHVTCRLPVIRGSPTDVR